MRWPQIMQGPPQPGPAQVRSGDRSGSLPLRMASSRLACNVPFLLIGSPPDNVRKSEQAHGFRSALILNISSSSPQFAAETDAGVMRQDDNHGCPDFRTGATTTAPPGLAPFGRPDAARRPLTDAVALR